MVYRKAKQKVRRVYSRGKSFFNGNIFKNPIVVGLAVGGIKNALTGKKIIDVEDIKTRISKMDATNPLIFLGAGILAKNPALMAIGAFTFIDPPDAEKNGKLTEYSNIGENQEPAEYSNVGGNEEHTEYSNIGENEEPPEPKKRCVY